MAAGVDQKVSDVQQQGKVSLVVVDLGGSIAAPLSSAASLV
jgi:hypothetical protein